MTHKSDKRLLTLLVELLPTHGCWPDDVVAMVQGGDQRVLFCGSGYNVCFSKSHDGWMAVSSAGWGNNCGDYSRQIQYGIPLAADYETAIVSATDFHEALKSSGWKAFHDGDQPVPDDTVVEVMYDSHEYESMEARGIWWPSVDFWREVPVGDPEADAEADAKEWGGVGFPKPGQRCMVLVGKTKYEPCEILYSDRAVGVAFRYLMDGYANLIDCVSASAAKDYFHPFNGTEPCLAAWNGEGNPFGLVEIKHKDATEEWAQPDFHEMVVEYFGNEVMVLTDPATGKETAGAHCNYDFRPYNAEAAEARKRNRLAIEAIAEVVNSQKTAKELYRMIEIGVIPGVKLDK